MPAYTHVSGTPQASASAALNVPYPAGDLTGDLILFYGCVRDFNGSGTAPTGPAGFTLLATSSPGTNDASWLYGRIGDGTETGTVSWDANAASAGQHAVMVAFPAPAGYAWPAVGTAFVAANESNNAGSTDLIYTARTISANGNLGIQFGKEPTTGTVTAVATTSGFTQAFWQHAENFVSAAQYREISGNLSGNSVAMTGNSGTSATGGLTAEFAPVVSGPTVTAADGTVQIGEAGLTHAPVAAGTEVFTASPAFAGAINGATLDPDGAAIDITSLLSNLSSTTARLTAPDVSLFRVGGAWNAIRWGVNYEIEFTDGTDTARVNCMFTAPVPTRFGAIVTPNATYHPGAAIATDESYGLWTLGEGLHNPANGLTTANIFVTGDATFQPFAYDLSASAWIEGTAVAFTESGSSITGAGNANKRQCNAIAAQGRRARVLELRRFRTPNTRPRLPGRRIRRSR